jgi:phage major head subunit gpT-like protein
MAQGAGYSSKQWPDEMVAEVINGAFTKECFDEQYFVDTDHPVADSTVSNKGTAALSISTLALAQASYGAGRIAMMSFTDKEGRPLGVIPNILMTGPALADTAHALLTVDRLEDGKPNPYKGTAELVIFPWITSTTAWFLLDTTKPVKPFIFQQRKAPVFVSLTDINTDSVFNNKKFKFGAEARGASGYGFWQTCYGSTGLG